jgi:hypothetical protein
MSGFVFILCAATAAACSVLLLRGYRRSGVRLLLWSGLCFAGLAAENAVLYADLVVLPDWDLMVARRLIGVVSVFLLVLGLVSDTE